ncbi:MAG: glycine zipper 2TM domain-containing protein [Pseudomonadota bacterium]
MNRKLITLPLILALTSSPLYAGHGHGQHKKHRGHDSFVVKARVSHVEPVIEVVQVPEQQRECWNEEVSGSHQRRSGGGALAGAIIGGVIGHNIGDSRHRRATTAMGTVIGATIGHDASRGSHTPYRYTEQHCEVSTHYVEEEQINGYRVHYRYKGERFVSHMDRDPGRFVRLRVSHQLLD